MSVELVGSLKILTTSYI